MSDIYDFSSTAENIIECMGSSLEPEENAIAVLLQSAEDDEDFCRMLRRIKDIATSALEELDKDLD